MNQLSEKLFGYAEHLLGYFRGLDLKWALLEPMISDRSLQLRYQGGGRSEGFAAIRQTMYFDCVLDIANLAFDNDDRTPSIRGVIAGLEDPRAKSELRHSYSELALTMEIDPETTKRELDSARIEWRAEHARDFDERYERLLANWRSFCEQRWVPGFQEIRDKVRGHFELKKVGQSYTPAVDISQLGLQWCDPGDAIRLMEPIVLDLYLLIQRAAFYMAASTSHFQRVAKEFWT